MQTQYRKADIVSLKDLHNTYETTDHDILNEYSPFNIRSVQHYNPIYSHFFQLDSRNVTRTTLKHKYAIRDLQTIVNTETGELIHKPVFIKFSPLLDPVKYMIGKYDMSHGSWQHLPTVMECFGCLVEDINSDELRSLEVDHIPDAKQKEHSSNTQAHKLTNPNNASYIDCFFSYLSSQLLHKHGLVNAIDFYGSYLGIQEKYKMSISDDIEYLCTSRYFNENVGKLFKISEEIHSSGNYGDGSRGHKRRLHIQSSLKSHNISMIDLDIVELTPDELRSLEVDAKYSEGTTERTSSEFHTYPPEQHENFSDICVSQEQQNSHTDEQNSEDCSAVVYEKPASRGSTESSSSSSSNSNLNYSTDDSDEEVCDDEEGDEHVSEENNSEVEEQDASEEEDDEYNEPEEKMFSYMDNFPVQMICLEKCTGTIDELLEKGMLSEKEGAAAMMQIVMTLIAYQRAFSFTHNDLHTNNIMYVPTDAEFLYYKYNKKTYQVPTYGRIFKLIDFGRSIYRFSGKTFCSDSFAPGGDAATQYNCEPYMNDKKPRLDPNPSFDLCRLGCSVYDFLIEDEEECHMDAFQKTIYRWCCDDNKKNILYKKDGEERYPAFKLYKMIARSVHNHSPQDQLQYPFFSQFVLSAKELKKMAKDAVVMDIDGIPSYM